MSKILRRLTAVLALITIICLGITGDSYALEVPPTPIDNPVVDLTNTLTADQRASISRKIADERSATGNQIAVLMIPSLDGEVLENYSLEVARGWGVGQKDRDSGVLLLIVKNDRQLRIEVGYGLEGALPDIRAAQIIRDRITPSFREGKYFEGIDSGVDGIVMAIHNETDPLLDKESAGTKPFVNGEMLGNLAFFGIFILVWLGSILARSKSWWAGGIIGFVAGLGAVAIFGFLFAGLLSLVGFTLFGLLFDRIVSGNYRSHIGSGSPPNWWAGGPWIGGGPPSGGGWSGGSGGFGGGSFGGGGASGSW